MNPLKSSKHQTFARAALIPALLSFGLFAGACGSDPKVVTGDGDGVEVSNLHVSPTATHSGGILALTFDVDASTAQDEPQSSDGLVV